MDALQTASRNSTQRMAIGREFLTTMWAAEADPVPLLSLAWTNTRNIWPCGPVVPTKRGDLADSQKPRLVHSSWMTAFLYFYDGSNSASLLSYAVCQVNKEDIQTCPYATLFTINEKFPFPPFFSEYTNYTVNKTLYPQVREGKTRP